MEQKQWPNEYNVRRHQEENAGTLARADNEAAGNPVKPLVQPDVPGGKHSRGQRPRSRRISDQIGMDKK